MTSGEPAMALVRLARESFDAAVFDLDGVLVRTARVHALAWKDTFDHYLARRAARAGQAWRPFDAGVDYRTYVDGRPRDAGVRGFLESRGIRLPEGTPADGPDLETVWGLGNRKRDRFLELLRAQGVEVDAHATAVAGAFRGAGLGTAVVSSSRNCRLILESAGLSAAFDTVVDGNELASHGLAGKPAPDMFLEAARRLAVDPARAVVFEDALADVQAGRRGGFGCVVGVDRSGGSAALLAAGAHITVSDLADVTLTRGRRRAAGLDDAALRVGPRRSTAGAGPRSPPFRVPRLRRDADADRLAARGRPPAGGGTTRAARPGAERTRDDRQRPRPG